MAYLNYSQQLYVGFLSAHLPVSAKIDVKAIQDPGYSGSEVLMTNAIACQALNWWLRQVGYFFSDCI
jgi:hypothetical protein